MKEIAKVLTNALVEVYLQNSKYETETIKKKQDTLAVLNEIVYN